MTNKFQTFFEKPYHEICHLIKRYVKDKYSVIDLGCNNGNLIDEIEAHKTGCVVYGVDTDAKAIKAIKNKKYQKIIVKVFKQDANKFLKTSNLTKVNVILINATLHEINNSEDQAEYLDWFFQTISKILKKNGLIIVGDYYYSNQVSNKEAESYIKYQRKMIHHADARNKFIFPILLRSKALKHGYSLVYSKEFRAVKEIDRRYYTFVFKKS